MSKPSPIDALCERWREYEKSPSPRNQGGLPNGDFEAARSQAGMCADELSRLAPLVAAVVEAGKYLRRRPDTDGVGDLDKSWDARLKAYEEGTKL